MLNHFSLDKLRKLLEIKNF